MSAPGDPLYAPHFSEEAARASYLLRVTKEPLVALSALSTIESEARRLQAVMVAEAREAGASWNDIAAAVGLTRQGAQKRFSAPST